MLNFFKCFEYTTSNGAKTLVIIRTSETPRIPAIFIGYEIVNCIDMQDAIAHGLSVAKECPETKFLDHGISINVAILPSKRLCFGWVSSNINGNYAAWANLKGYGTEEEAEVFFQETRAEAEIEQLEWFCTEIEMEGANKI